MKRIAILATALAVLVLGTGAVMAQPGNAPVDVPGEQPTDGEHQAEQEMNETDQIYQTDQMDEIGANASEHASSQADVAAGAHADNGEQGPPVEMPAQVPDHVSEIHEMIQRFIGGDLDGSLGESLQDLLAENGDQTPNEHADENATATQDA